MTDTATLREASLANKQATALQTILYTIPVADIQLGMVVHAIGEQAGSLAVKNKGMVKSLSIINKLSEQGIISVVIEPFHGANEKIDPARKKLNIHVNRPQTSTHNSVEVEHDELAKLLKRSASLHSQYTLLIQKNLQVNFTEVKALVSSVYKCLVKKPDDLLIQAMLRNSTTYLASHAIRVAILMCHFANYLGMSQADCERIGLVGYLFDIGMAKVPLTIRQKTGSLSPEECLEMQKHVGYSLQLVEGLALDRECILAIEQHHERLDGNGYPNGYEGSNIHKYSRMLAIIDCYDALTSDRPYHLPITPAGALKILSNPEYAYDQKLVLQFIKCLGIYPVGSLVALSNKHIGLVTKSNRETPTSPELKIIYSIADRRYVMPATIDLATTDNITIVKPVLASQFNIELESLAQTLVC